MTSKVGVDFPSVEEASGGGNIREGEPLTKGHWTKAEDEILIDYIAKYGKGNWNSIHKLTGLARCGKSCRLRWANHLRPGLKKGPFTPEEEALIIELHAKIGKKWSRMAAELPGRSDNDIKNFWNTRQKKLRRLGLLMDHPDVCIQAFSEDKQNKEPGASSSANAHPDLFPSYNLEIPAAEFNNFEPSQQSFSPELLNMVSSSFPDIPGTSSLNHGLNSSCNTHSVHSTVHPPKRTRGSESRFSDLNADLFQTPHQYQNAGSLLPQPSGSSSPYPSFLGEIHLSSSESKWPRKLELPSIQTPMTSWVSPSPLPSLQSSNILIQSPRNDHTDSGSLTLSPRNSGLLDAVIYGSQKSKA